MGVTHGEDEDENEDDDEDDVGYYHDFMYCSHRSASDLARLTRGNPATLSTRTQPPHTRDPRRDHVEPESATGRQRRA